VSIPIDPKRADVLGITAQSGRPSHLSWRRKPELSRQASRWRPYAAADRGAAQALGQLVFADIQALALYYGAGVAGYATAGFLNFFLRRPFVADAVLGFALATALAAGYLVFFTQKQLPFGEAATADWRILPAAVLILFALFVLAALALACSTRLDTIPTLAVCTGLFALGLVSDYLFGRPASTGQWWAQILYDLTPNWQQLYLAEALEDKGTIPWAYVGRAAGYSASLVVAALSVALILFEDRELG
jgi:hypothetical protein